MNENQPGSTRIDAWFLSIAALVSTALALGCSGSDGRGQEKGGTKEIRTIVVRAAAFSPDAKLLVLATGPGAPSASAKLAPQRAMLLFDAESGKTLRGFELEKPANGVFFLEGGKKLLVWKNYGEFMIYDVGTGILNDQYSGDGWVLAMMPDGKQLLVLTGDERGGALELWDAYTGRAAKKLSAKMHPGSTAAISSNGKWALIPCQPRLTKAGKIDETIMQLWNLRKGEIRLSFALESELEPPLSFSPNSKFAVAQRLDEENPDGRNHRFSLVVLEIPSGKVLRILEKPLRSRQIVRFSPDGKELVICDEPPRTPSENPRLRRLQAETGKQLWSVELPVDKTEEMVCAFSADGTKFFRGSGETFSLRTLKLEIWDSLRGKKLHDLIPEPPK